MATGIYLDVQTWTARPCHWSNNVITHSPVRDQVPLCVLLGGPSSHMHGLSQARLITYARDHISIVHRYPRCCWVKMIPTLMSGCRLQPFYFLLFLFF